MHTIVSSRMLVSDSFTALKSALYGLVSWTVNVYHETFCFTADIFHCACGMTMTFKDAKYDKLSFRNFHDIQQFCHWKK